ncbi:hypothetical protein J1N35_037619, partial [Gossypium stocksii]
DDDGEEIQNNAPPQVSNLVPSSSLGILETEARDALIEMTGHILVRWFDRYMGAIPTLSLRHHDESVR